MDEQINYYAVIPANVRYDENLPPSAKLLYGEITALCNQNGYCWATNDYFAKLYKCTRQSVSSWISQLKERGYISIEFIYEEGSKKILNRYVKIFEYPIQKNLNTPIQKNLKENNTFLFNITSEYKERNIKERTNGHDEILSTVSDASLRELYLEYIKMRKLIKAPMTDRALQMLITKVNNLETDVERQKELLETAILNNWKSVYPLKGEDKNADTERVRGEVQYGTVL